MQPCWEKDGCNHLNVAKLDAILKGIDLALGCGLHDIKIWTDLPSVLGGGGINDYHRKGFKQKKQQRWLLSDMWHLGIWGELINEFILKLHVMFVPLEKNKITAFKGRQDSIFSVQCLPLYSSGGCFRGICDGC